jgi:cell division protein FtsW
MLKFNSSRLKIDRTLIFLVLGLSIFGILMIFNASSVTATENFGNKFYFVRLQILWVLLGLTVMTITSKINYHHWRKISPPLFLISVSFLILVLIPGIGVKVMGGRRWLSFAGFSFPIQPAELAKISTILYLATFLEKKRKFLHFLVILGLLSFLLILEPDLGTAVILTASAFVVYFLSGGRLTEMLLTLFLGLVGGAILIVTSPYRMSRLQVFLNPNLDPQGQSYHLRQVLLALGSGGFWGRGIGQSRQKFLFLPEAATDSIFAIVGEELGFIGSVAIVSVFLILMFIGLKIASEAPDKFGQVLAGGITSMIFLQAFLNLAATVSLVPLTGVPLPFLSYGGSFLLVVFWGIGILLNVWKSGARSRK